MSILHTKVSHRIQYILFYRAFQEFEYIYCSFLMTQVDTKFWDVFILHRSDLHTKISHCIQHIFFYRALKKTEYINVYKIYCITTKYWSILKIHRQPKQLWSNRTSGLTYIPLSTFIGTEIYIDLGNGQNQSQKGENMGFCKKVPYLWFLSNLAYRKFLHQSFKRTKKKKPIKSCI